MRRAILLGDVKLDAVLEESPSQDSAITDKGVEQGSDITDHVRVQNPVMRLSGTMVEDAAAKLAVLKRYQREATLLRYVGRNAYHNVVIESLSTNHALDTAEGYHYSMTLRQIRLAQPKTYGVTVKNPVTNQQDKKTATKVKEKTNVGRQQVKEVG